MFYTRASHVGATLDCRYLIVKNLSKKGHNSCINVISLDGVGCSFDSEHMLQILSIVNIFSNNRNISKVNPFPNKPWFFCVCSTSLLKTLWKKEKLLVSSNFSFSHIFSTHLENFLPFSSNVKLSSANSFSFKESKKI